MASILALHKATVGTQTYFFLQSPNAYGGSIDTATGVEEADPKTDLDEPTVSVATLVSKGKLFRVLITYSTATAKKTAKLLVTKDKLSSVFDSLIGETFKSVGTITSVRIPQKATFF